MIASKHASARPTFPHSAHITLQNITYTLNLWGLTNATVRAVNICDAVSSYYVSSDKQTSMQAGLQPATKRQLQSVAAAEACGGLAIKYNKLKLNEHLVAEHLDDADS